MSLASQCPDCCTCLAPVYAMVPSVSGTCESLTIVEDGPPIVGASCCALTTGYGDLVADTETGAYSYNQKYGDGGLQTNPNSDCSGLRYKNTYSDVRSGSYVLDRVTNVVTGGGTLTIGNSTTWVPETARCVSTVTSYPELRSAATTVGDTAIAAGCSTGGFYPDWEGEVSTETDADAGTLIVTTTSTVTGGAPPPVDLGSVGDNYSFCYSTGRITRVQTYELSAGSVIVTVALSVTGAPSTSYDLRVRYTNACDGEQADDTFEDVEVTTDEDGIAEVEFVIPNPESSDCTRCFAGVTSNLYTFKFTVPKTGQKNCYRIDWVERAIEGKDGVPLDSIEVAHSGVYRPTAAYSTPPLGGIQAQAVVTMSATGTITGVHLLNPGWGYTSPPTFTVEPAVLGGTSSTGWTTTIDSEGRVTGTSGGSAGDYRPTVVLSGDATATCELLPTGGISTITITSGGTGYAGAPSVTVVPKVSSGDPAVVYAHLGTEVARSWQWAEGDIPAGYDPLNSATWPSAGEGGRPYFTLGDPNATIENVRSTCYACSETSGIPPLL